MSFFSASHAALHEAGATPFEAGPSPGTLIGYRAARYDPERNRAVSGADARVSWPLQKGALHTTPRNGMYLTPFRQYALDYYAVHDLNVLLKYEFRLEDVVWGRESMFNSREPEIGVGSAVLLDYEVFAEEDL